MCEIWRKIKGFPNYEVSNLGRVKSNLKILKPYVEKVGYKRVTLYHNKKGIINRIHTLVAKSFIPNIYNKNCVNHIDGDKGNNRDDNLEWVTYKENMEHACKYDLNARGTRIGISKLNKGKVIKIRKLYKNDNISQRDLAKMFDVCQRTITMAVNNITWKNI